MIGPRKPFEFDKRGHAEGDYRCQSCSPSASVCPECSEVLHRQFYGDKPGACCDGCGKRYGDAVHQIGDDAVLV